MASPGAALSVQRSPRVAAQTALVVGVMALVAAFAILLLAATEDFTAPTTWPRHVVTTHPEPQHPLATGLSPDRGIRPGRRAAPGRSPHRVVWRRVGIFARISWTWQRLNVVTGRHGTRPSRMTRSTARIASRMRSSAPVRAPKPALPLPRPRSSRRRRSIVGKDHLRRSLDTLLGSHNAPAC